MVVSVRDFLSLKYHRPGEELTSYITGWRQLVGVSRVLFRRLNGFVYSCSTC